MEEMLLFLQVDTLEIQGISSGEGNSNAFFVPDFDDLNGFVSVVSRTLSGGNLINDSYNFPIPIFWYCLSRLDIS